MKEIRGWFIGVFILFVGCRAFGQTPLLYEHSYPVIVEEDPRVRSLMDSVSKDRIEGTINHLQSYFTRRWDSRMVYEVQDWLYDSYAGMGFDTVFLHDFTFMHHDSLCETSDNVIAIQRGLVHPEEYVVCGAHYDSYNNAPGHPDSLRAPGADDNASGVAGVMEMARLLSQYQFDRSIVYCHFAAEEVGLKGSEAFANDCASERLDLVGYFNLDMIGYLEEGSDIHVCLMYTTRDSIIADYVFNFSEVYFPDMPIRQSWLSWGDSDYSSFNRSGYAAVHTFEETHASSPYIHSENDLLGVSVNNLDQAKRFTKLNLGLVATLAGMRSHSVEELENDVISVYPNPASHQITLQGPDLQRVEVYNGMGQQVLVRSFGGSEKAVLDVEGWTPGLYFLRVGKTGTKVLIEN